MQNAIQTKSNKQHTTSPPPPPVNHRSVLSSLSRSAHLISSLIRPVHVNLLSSSLSVKRRGIELNRRCKDRTMEHYSSPGGTWTMIPTPNSNPQIQSQSQSQSNQDPNHYLQQQQQQQFLQQQQPFQQPQTTQSQFQQQQQLYQQQQQQQRILQQQQQQQPPQQQQNLHQSLASHFHLLNLVENLAEVVEHGNPDQQSDALITELSNHFEKCQQLLNSISASISTKAMTVEGQKKKLEESEQLLNQRRDLIANYTKSVEELVRSEP